MGAFLLGSEDDWLCRATVSIRNSDGAFFEVDAQAKEFANVEANEKRVAEILDDMDIDSFGDGVDLERELDTTDRLGTTVELPDED